MRTKEPMDGLPARASVWWRLRERGRWRVGMTAIMYGGYTIVPMFDQFWVILIDFSNSFYFRCLFDVVLILLMSFYELYWKIT